MMAFPKDWTLAPQPKYLSDFDEDTHELYYKLNKSKDKFLSRNQRIEMMGNAIVPLVAHELLRLILTAELFHDCEHLLPAPTQP